MVGEPYYLNEMNRGIFCSLIIFYLVLVLSYPTGDTLFFLIAVLLAGIAVYYFLFGRRAIVRAVISRTATKKIGDVKDGEEASIRGKIIFSGRTMIAPLSQRKCVYYHVTVKDSGSRNDLLRNNIDLNEERASDVVITDGEHYAVIDTKLMTSYIIKDKDFYSGFLNFSTPELQAFLVKHGEKPANLLGWSLNLIAREGVLEEGEQVTIAGIGTWRKASDFRFKLPSEKILYMSPLNENGVYLTDDPYIGDVLP